MPIEFPKIRFKNVDEAKVVLGWCYPDKPIPQKVFPCIKCSGLGKEIDEDNSMDPYGRASYSTCIRCSGSGSIHEKAFMFYYRKEKDKDHKEVQEFNRVASRAKLLLNEMDKDDYEILKKYFSNGWGKLHGIYDRDGIRWIPKYDRRNK